MAANHNFSEVEVQPVPANLDDPAEARAEVARLRRCLTASQDELADATNARKRKKTLYV